MTTIVLNAFFFLFAAMDAHILQITALSRSETFVDYILPTRKITPAAAAVTGLPVT